MGISVRIASCLVVFLWWNPSYGSDEKSSDTNQSLQSEQDRACSPSAVQESQSEWIFRTEQRFHERINELRKESKLDSLNPHEILRRAGRSHSCRMAEEDFFSHTEPSGKTVADRVREAGLKFTAVGENIGMARNVPDPVEVIIKSWMNSEGHRKNILHRTFTHTGVGLYKDGETLYITQVFAGGIVSP